MFFTLEQFKDAFPLCLAENSYYFSYNYGLYRLTETSSDNKYSNYTSNIMNAW